MLFCFFFSSVIVVKKSGVYVRIDRLCIVNIYKDLGFHKRRKHRRKHKHEHKSFMSSESEREASTRKGQSVDPCACACVAAVFTVK